MRTVKAGCWLLLLSLCWVGTVCAATITVQPESNPVVLGQEFTLTFYSNERPDGAPDFSPLGRDFEIISTSNNQSVQVINGVATKEYAWRLQLFPKGSGELTIPPIPFGRDQSEPLTLKVTDDPGLAGQQQNILVELEVDNLQPYVQQQVTITQRLLHAVSLRRNGASMTHPDIVAGKGQIEPLNDGRVDNKSVVRDGITYKVSERRYALFASSSGELTIGPTVFQGILDDGQRRYDPFGMSGKQVRRFSQPLTLSIQAQPKTSTNEWLPANSLTVNTYWQTPPDQLKTGEPVNLTVAIIADGLMAEQLPELVMQPPKGLKVYSNQAELRNDTKGAGLLGTRQERWILIGTAPGAYDLPEIGVTWWDLKTGKEALARFEKTRVVVTGAAPANTNQTDPDPMTAAPVTATESAPAAVTDSATTADTDLLAQAEQEPALPLARKTPAMRAEEAQHARSLSLSIGLIVLGLLAALMLYLYFRRRLSAKRSAKQIAPNPRINALDLLQQACQRNEAQKAYDALSDWVRLELQLSPATLARLRQVADLPLKQALDDLSMTLYARQQAHWEGQALWQAVQQYVQDSSHNPAADSDTQAGGLLRLYPE